VGHLSGVLRKRWVRTPLTVSPSRTASRGRRRAVGIAWNARRADAADAVASSGEAAVWATRTTRRNAPASGQTRSRSGISSHARASTNAGLDPSLATHLLVANTRAAERRPTPWETVGWYNRRVCGLLVVIVCDPCALRSQDQVDQTLRCSLAQLPDRPTEAAIRTAPVLFRRCPSLRASQSGRQDFALHRPAPQPCVFSPPLGRVVILSSPAMVMDRIGPASTGTHTATFSLQILPFGARACPGLPARVRLDKAEVAGSSPASPILICRRPEPVGEQDEVRARSMSKSAASRGRSWSEPARRSADEPPAGRSAAGGDDARRPGAQGAADDRRLGDHDRKAARSDWRGPGRVEAPHNPPAHSRRE
jgi:hypothetical protein